MCEPPDLSDILNLNEFFHAAAQQLDPTVYSYYEGGAADNITRDENAHAYQRIKLLPRYMIDVSHIDMTTQINGHRCDLPLGVAPMAMMGVAHPEKEIAIAKACNRFNIPMILSTMSNTAIEELAPYHDNLWFQLYVQKDRGVTHDLVSRAEAAGFKGLVVTVDVPVPGYRENLMRRPVTIPDDLELANLRGYWDRAQYPSAHAYAAGQFDPALTWKDLEQFVQQTNLPVYPKGILHPDDARRAIEHGASGVIVSNHGGRQLDTVPATIDVLPVIADAVAGHVVIVDGGIRRGTDIVKALALGAKAVLIGRPIAFALACGGEAGVNRALEIISKQLSNAMALCGTPDISSITADVIYAGG